MSPTNPLDFRFSLDFFQRIPEAPGVFWMQDSRRQILFVGASEKLRTDLMQFKNMRWHETTDDIRELCQRVKQIDWNSTSTVDQAQEMKKAMIRQCHPPFNKKAKAAVPHSIEVRALTPKRIQLHWGEAINSNPNTSIQIFGPFYGRNTLHRTYSALLRWIWIVGNPQSAEAVPPHFLKPLLRNDMEVPIGQLFFENHRWINSLSRFLNGYSDLFLDFGLRKVETMASDPTTRISKELLMEDLVLLERFFKRYSRVSHRTTSASTEQRVDQVINR